MSSRTGIALASAGNGGRRRQQERRPAGFMLGWLLAALLAAYGAAGAQALAAEPGPAPPPAAGPIAATPPAPAATPGTPAVEEWLNQTVRLRETVRATSLPAAGAKPAGEIRAGAEVKAIGLVAGKEWVEIELPDRSRAFVPRAAIAYEAGGETTPPPPGRPTAAPPAAVGAAPQAASPAVTPAAATAEGAAETIRGKVTRVPNAATLVVGDQRLRLSGIDPGPSAVLAAFESWVRGQGEVVCEPEAQTGRYRCFTGSGVDVAEAAILNGSGRVGDGAIPEYRTSEAQARQQKRGLWGQP